MPLNYFGVWETPMLTRPIIDAVVDRMLEIWENADKWMKGASAEDEGGEELEPTSAYAVKWCAVGCRAKALNDLGLFVYDHDLNEFMDHYARELTYPVNNPYQDTANYPGVVSYNDSEHTTFEDVRLFIKTLKDKPVPWKEEEEECCAD